MHAFFYRDAIFKSITISQSFSLYDIAAIRRVPDICIIESKRLKYLIFHVFGICHSRHSFYYRTKYVVICI